MAVLCTRDDVKCPEEVSSAPVEPTVQERASVQWPSFVPETMSSAQEKFLQHRLNRRSKKGHRCNGRPLYQRRCQVPRRSFFSTGSTDGASVHWPSFVPETMSSAQKKFLQHRFNRRCIGAYHRCNDVSIQEKIPSAPVEPVKHRCIASVQPVVSASAV